MSEICQELVTETTHLLEVDSYNPLRVQYSKMENGGFEESSADDHPVISPMVPTVTSSGSCRCEEEQAHCSCKKHIPPQPKQKIELQSSSKTKIYFLIGIVAVLVVWGAVYFTLLGLDYV
ncbi:uncharacterized protein [Palaemon carinicauda]|uniref:uncharacterized protein isoform X2 n=1 Tax=Palaemon carinicauda TaxID=392227 RepID=UPI0035B69013